MTPFQKAFAEARKGSKATFMFEGKKYTTRLKGEAEGITNRPKTRSGSEAKPLSSQRPKTRPEADKPSAAPATSQRPKTRPGAAGASTPSNKPPAVTSTAPVRGPDPKPAAPIKGVPARDNKPKQGVLGRLFSGKGGISDRKPTKSTKSASSGGKGPSVSQVAKAKRTKSQSAAHTK